MKCGYSLLEEKNCFMSNAILQCNIDVRKLLLSIGTRVPLSFYEFILVTAYRVPELRFS